MASRVSYPEVFAKIFLDARPNRKMTLQEVLGDPRLPSVSLGTKKAHLRSYIEQNPSDLKHVTGLIPKPETVIALVESEIGSIVEKNLDAANLRCSEVVNSIARPIVDDFVREGLSQCFDPSKDEFKVPAPVLIQFLLEDFTGHLKAAGNGLVSIAGSLNEKLLHRAMINTGMQLNRDFSVTGTDSDGDIVIHTSAGSRAPLGVEVKSYHARERLLRGLKDVKEPKVGVGYFKDPSEFNHGRTITLLQAKPAAIYMPLRTLSNVEAAARAATTNEKIAYGSALYRPLERFVTDMQHYAATGELPRYAGS